MQIRELVQLGHFLKTFIRQRGLVNQYQELINAVGQAAQNQNPQNVTKLLQQLMELHDEAENQVLSPAQRKLMSDYGADQLLGRLARERIERIFQTHQANPQALIADLHTLMNETNQLVTRSDLLIKTLGPMLDDDSEVEELDEEEGSLWLYFDDAATVKTIDDLEKAAETWKEILHHFSRLPGATGGSPRILQIRMNSPLELEVAARIALLAPLAFGVNWVLSRVEHVIKICQEAERLRQLKVKTKIVKELYADAQEQRKRIASEAAEEIKKRFKGDNETRNATEQALKKILAFVEKGGQLDINVGEPEDASDETTGETAESNPRVEIRKLVASIRKDIKLLPPRAVEEPIDDDDDRE